MICTTCNGTGAVVSATKKGKTCPDCKGTSAPPPTILVGETSSRQLVELLAFHSWGRIWTTKRPTPYDGEPWAFDNCAYSWWSRGEPFDEGLYERRRDRAVRVGVPYFAVLPDLVAQGMESLEYSMCWLERQPREWDGVHYIAVQDGMDVREVREAARDLRIGGLFLGGSTRFKQTALTWRGVADALGKRFHYGRCGTLRRVRFARLARADSLDSSLPLWTRGRLDDFIEICNAETVQLDLFS